MKIDEKIHTIADIEALPDGTRAELIDGKMYMMAPPTATHQLLLNYINNKIYNYIEAGDGTCTVFPAPFAVYLDNGRNYVEPDIVLLCNKDKYDEKGCYGGPDLVIEIVSPASVRMDYVIKLFQYRAAGVREYWIVDPMKQRIQVYNLEIDDMTEYAFQDKVPLGIYQGKLEINFNTFWEKHIK